MSESGTIEFSAETKAIGDKIAGLTLKQAKELSDYLKAEYGIEPAAGGAVVMAAPGGAAGGGAAAAAEKTEFDVVLVNAGAEKLKVVKAVKTITGLGLPEAKKMVDSAPVTVKTGVSKEEAAKFKAEIEAEGGVAEVK